MIPSNIDLTENRDFSGGNAWIIPFDIPTGDFWERYDGEHISSEDFDKLLRWEQIFGEKGHPNHKRVAFNKDKDDEQMFLERQNYHCYRCGRDIRVPWKIKLGLCSDCEKETHFEDSYGLPSDSDGLFDKPRMMSVHRDLFGLR